MNRSSETATEFIISEPDDAPAGSEQSISEHSELNSYSDTYDDDNASDLENFLELENDEENDDSNDGTNEKGIRNILEDRRSNAFHSTNTDQSSDGDEVYEEADLPNDDEVKILSFFFDFFLICFHFSISPQQHHSMVHNRKNDIF